MQQTFFAFSAVLIILSSSTKSAHVSYSNSSAHSQRSATAFSSNGTLIANRSSYAWEALSQTEGFFAYLNYGKPQQMESEGQCPHQGEDLRRLESDGVRVRSTVCALGLDVARDHVFGHAFEFLSSESDDALLFVVVFLYVIAHKTIIMEEIGWKTVH